ncbi:MAG: hypothetical protein JJE52_10605 [Acidimicrobiia bacterium]|nr:hypothetical protein [Acidimicrobiia bacterium]
MAAVIRQPAFIAMTAAVALASLVGTGLMFHHLDLLAERGLTSSEAAVVFLPLTISGAVAALVAGRASDRVPPRFVAAAAMVLMASSPLLVQEISTGVVAALYGTVLGASGTIVRTVEATALPRWFGIATIGQIRGILMAAGVGASAIGPLFVSVGRDLAGGYGPVLNLLALISAALAVAVAVVRPPTTPPPVGVATMGPSA